MVHPNKCWPVQAVKDKHVLISPVSINVVVLRPRQASLKRVMRDCSDI